jgi:hypothetical protein
LDNTKNLIEGLSKVDYTRIEKFETTNKTQLDEFLSSVIDNNDSVALHALKKLNIPELQSAIDNAHDVQSQ